MNIISHVLVHALMLSSFMHFFPLDVTVFLIYP